jgi:hypothetical protein
MGAIAAAGDVAADTAGDGAAADAEGWNSKHWGLEV